MSAEAVRSLTIAKVLTSGRPRVTVTAPLVAPGRRGLQRVIWLERVGVQGDADPGVIASIVWGSFTAAGA